MLTVKYLAEASRIYTNSFYRGPTDIGKVCLVQATRMAASHVQQMIGICTAFILHTLCYLSGVLSNSAPLLHLDP